MSDEPTKSVKVRPDWREIALAYEEAAEHLDMCAAESLDAEEKAAMKIVAARIRQSGDRVKPTRMRGLAVADHHSTSRPGPSHLPAPEHLRQK